MTNEMSMDQITSLLDATPAMLRSLVAEADPALPSWRPAPQEWCINEVLGHIIEAERRGFAGRIRIILAQDNPQLEDWNPNQVTTDRQDCEKDFTTLLAEFETLRAEGVPMVRSLKPDQLLRAGEHPRVGALRVVDLLHEWIHHDYNHTKQILSNVQAYVWPHMGNARRFS